MVRERKKRGVKERKPVDAINHAERKQSIGGGGDCCS